MHRGTHLRRVFILCCHSLRNLAFFYACRPGGVVLRAEQFWITTSNNFLDIAILEWCKLFADVRGKHHWSKVVDDRVAFEQGLYEAMTLTSGLFDDYILEIRTYRDKWVAHLDMLERMSIPNLRACQRSTSYLYDFLLRQEGSTGVLADVQFDAKKFYKIFQEEGATVLAR